MLTLALFGFLFWAPVPVPGTHVVVDDDEVVVNWSIARDANGTQTLTPDINIDVETCDEAASGLHQLLGEQAAKSYMSIWAVFERPLDYPEGYVIRQSVVMANPVRIVISPFSVKTDALREARQKLPRGLRRLPRQPFDPPFVIESYL
jgi:hypothetical protein